MESEILAKIFQNSTIQPGDNLIIAVSGGADSVYLLHQLAKAPLHLVIAHFNHKLRPTSDSDSKFVHALADSLQLPFVYGEGDVTAYSHETNKSIEESARILRYRFLVQTAIDNGSNFIATAHQANDQVETLLMHLLRGSGLRGLAGMDYCTIIPEFHQSISILRPLLSIWRADIERYLNDLGIQYCIDESNEDKKYFRNNIRHEILPYLATQYPSLQNNLWNTSEVLRSDLLIIEEIVQQKWEKIKIFESPHSISMDKTMFLKENAGIQRNLIRKIFFLISPTIRDISFSSIERVRAAINNKHSGMYDLEGNVVMHLFGDRAVISQIDYDWMSDFIPQMRDDIPLEIHDVGIYDLNQGWQIAVSLSILEKGELNFKTHTELTANLDFEKMHGFPIMVHVPQKGEKFQPLGMENGTMKVSVFFINQKVPQLARKHYPLVCNQFNEIAWIAGLRLANTVRVTKSTRKILHLEICKK